MKHDMTNIRKREVFLIDTNWFIDGFVLKEGRYIFKDDLKIIIDTCNDLNFHLATSNAIIDEIFEKHLRNIVIKSLEIINVMKDKARTLKSQLNFYLSNKTPQWQDLTLILAVEKFGKATIVSSDYHLINTINMLKNTNIVPYTIDAEFNGNFLLELGELATKADQKDIIRNVWKRICEVELKRMLTSPDADGAERMAEYLVQYARRREERINDGREGSIHKLLMTMQEERLPKFFDNETFARLWPYFKK
ncbi:MAG: hypothetical protein ACXAEU_14945 [Candidatus Hodarchaeales archaeon]|jgi:hypothetical protein